LVVAGVNRTTGNRNRVNFKAAKKVMMGRQRKQGKKKYIDFLSRGEYDQSGRTKVAK